MKHEKKPINHHQCTYRVLEDDASIVSPRASKINGTSTSDGRFINDVVVRVCRGTTGSSDVSARNLSKAQANQY